MGIGHISPPATNCSGAVKLSQKWNFTTGCGRKNQQNATDSAPGTDPVRGAAEDGGGNGRKRPWLLTILGIQFSRKNGILQLDVAVKSVNMHTWRISGDRPGAIKQCGTLRLNEAVNGLQMSRAIPLGRNSFTEDPEGLRRTSTVEEDWGKASSIIRTLDRAVPLAPDIDGYFPGTRNFQQCRRERPTGVFSILQAAMPFMAVWVGKDA